MAITYDWRIAKLDHEIEDGFVFTAHWTVSAAEPTGETDEDGSPVVYSAYAYGSAGFSRPLNLIPYNNLTKEIVVGWVKEKFSENQLQEIEQGLAAQIESQKHPTSSSGVPW
jgi:hypothetical protein